MSTEAILPGEQHIRQATAQTLHLSEGAHLPEIELPQSVTFLALSSLSPNIQPRDIEPITQAYLRLVDWEIMITQEQIVGSAIRNSSPIEHLSPERQRALEEGVVVIEVGDHTPKTLLQQLAPYRQVIGNDVLRLTSQHATNAQFAERVNNRPNRTAYVVPTPQFLSLRILERDPEFALLQSYPHLALFIRTALETIPHTPEYERAQDNLVQALKNVIAGVMIDTSGQTDWGTRQSAQNGPRFVRPENEEEGASLPPVTGAKVGNAYETVRIVGNHELDGIHPRQRAQHVRGSLGIEYFVLRDVGGRRTLSPLKLESVPSHTNRQQLARAAITMLYNLSDWRGPTIHDLFFYIGRDGITGIFNLLKDPLLNNYVIRQQQPWEIITESRIPAPLKQRRRIAKNLVLATLLFATIGLGTAATAVSIKDASFGTSQSTTSEADHLEGVPSSSNVDWKIESHGLAGDGYYITDTVAQMTDNQYTLISSVDHAWQPIQVNVDTPYQTVSAPLLVSGIRSLKMKIPLLAGTTASSISLTAANGDPIPFKAVVLTDGTISLEITGNIDYALHPTAARLSYNLIQSNEGPHAAINPSIFAVNLADFQKIDPQMYQTVLGLQQQVLAGQNPDVVVTNYLEQNYTTYSIHDPSLHGLSKEQILSQLLRMQKNGFHCSYSNLLKIMLIASITPSTQKLPPMTIAQGWKLNTGSVDSSTGDFLTAANEHAFVLAGYTPDDYTPSNINPNDTETTAYVSLQKDAQPIAQLGWQKEQQQLQQEAQQLSLIIDALGILIPATIGLAAYEGIRSRKRRRKYRYSAKRKNKHLYKISKFIGTSAREISSLPEKTKREMIRQLETNLFAHFSSEELLFAVNYFNGSSWAANYGSTQLGSLTDNFGFKAVVTGQEAIQRISTGAHFGELREMLRVNDFNRFYKQFYGQRKMLLHLINKQREKQQLPPLLESEFNPSRAYAFKYWALAKYAFLYGMYQERQRVARRARK